jgi:heptaprenyl diphosphate synthase
MAMLLAVIVVLTSLEHMLPPIPLMPPNVRLGLSNIVTMYALFFIGKKKAFILTSLKSCYVFLIRGATAGALSLVGGVLSLVAMSLVMALFSSSGYLLLSVVGAFFHNLGQLACASLLTQTNLVMYWMPAMSLMGVVMGVVTGTSLKVLMPVFDKLVFNDKDDKKR